jgi:hypothetical protein
MNAHVSVSRAALCAALTIPLLCACGRGRAPAPAAAPQAPPPAAPYPAAVRLYYDNGGGIQDSMRLVIKDAAGLQRVWENATSRQSSPPAAPTVDFGRDMLAVIAAGRMTPDDQIRVDSVAVTRRMNAAGRMEEVLNIFVRTTTGCRRFNADAYPLEIIRLKRFEGTIEFIERRDQAEGCRDPEASPEALE